MKISGRHPGFRFSVGDAGVICAGAVVTVGLWPFIESFSLIVVVVIAHFFLFCNVFRVRRKYELLWAAVFVANVLAWSLFGIMSWRLIVAAQSPFTIAAIAMEIASEQYHGVGCRWKRKAAMK